MAKIAYILLTHKDPDGIIAQAERLTSAGDCVSIHFDANAKPSDYDKLTSALRDNPNVVFAAKRVKCGWGEWSLIEGTLQAVRAAESAFPDATHFYMLSGDCMAIKSAEYAHDFLDKVSCDYIESFDFFDSDWIQTGIKEERLVYRHFFNERKHKWLFYASMNLQKKLHLKRKIPSDIQMMIGSQWWCLRRRTIEAVLEFCRKRPDVMRFFKTTWIPDETFFQTLVRHLVPGTEIQARTLTFLMFSDYGMPVTFYNDHYDFLLAQDYLFARKISPDAQDLKTRLGDLYASNTTEFSISDEGRTLYKFLTQRGRVSRRFAPRFWEKAGTIGRERELLIIVCKKWHVGKRLTEAIKHATGITTLDYILNEDSASLPDLGGIQNTLPKRNRHRRALLGMLFEYYETNRIAFCLDPSEFGAIQDFYADRCITRLLEIECGFSDEYLVGHAKRVGLAGENTSPALIEKLLPTLRNDIEHESERIRDEGFVNYHRIKEDASADGNASALAALLGIPDVLAQEIAHTPHLFSD